MVGGINAARLERPDAEAGEPLAAVHCLARYARRREPCSGKWTCSYRRSNRRRPEDSDAGRSNRRCVRSRRAATRTVEATLSFPHHFAHDTQKVSAHDLLDVRLAVAAFEQSRGERRHFRFILQAPRRVRDAVEIATDADVINARN